MEGGGGGGGVTTLGVFVNGCLNQLLLALRVWHREHHAIVWDVIRA
jgi:hypothetical protein